jgi:cobalt-precorrin-5B (C1)-methyltransferase
LRTKKRLRTGFTTGAAAAAAAKGALLHILEGSPPPAVAIDLLSGERIRVAVHSCRKTGTGQAACTVIKDAGDDPDVTHGAEIGAVVRIGAGGGPAQIRIEGGAGVGRVTKPGLEVPAGEPAINPGPRRMITQALAEVLAAHGRAGLVEVEVFVPRGAEISRKTLNARLGILGGISILGTTGVVRPMSHAAFVATIAAALSVARAAGHSRVVLTTGRRSERHAQACWPQLAEEAFIQIGDFFQKSLEMAAAKGFDRVTLAAFFGKALKMAEGVPHTHAAASELSMQTLSRRVLGLSADAGLAGRIRVCNTAREAFALLAAGHPEIIGDVGRRMAGSGARFAGPAVRVSSVIFDYEGNVAFDSER